MNDVGYGFMFTLTYLHFGLEKWVLSDQKKNNAIYKFLYFQTNLIISFFALFCNIETFTTITLSC